MKTGSLFSDLVSTIIRETTYTLTPDGKKLVTGYLSLIESIRVVLAKQLDGKIKDPEHVKEISLNVIQFINAQEWWTQEMEVASRLATLTSNGKEVLNGNTTVFHDTDPARKYIEEAKI